MPKVGIDIDDESLARAAEARGTTTKKDTVNAALREVGEQGDFAVLADKTSYRS